MSFAAEMADVARDLLGGPEEDTLGEDIVIERRSSNADYDPATRRREDGAGTLLTQTVRGSTDSSLPAPDGLAQVFERVLYAAPLATGGFEPKEQDRVYAEGKWWIVQVVAHVIKQGVDVLWICGLTSA